MKLFNRTEIAPAITSECYHCGEHCNSSSFSSDEKLFCCEGCLLVYDLLKDNQLCTYYSLNGKPGISPGAAQKGMHDYLDLDEVSSRLISFNDGKQAHINFYIPGMHCSSCIWLLENLHRLNQGIAHSTVNFLTREVFIVYNVTLVKISEIVNLLANIGYPPRINLGSLESKKEKTNHSAITRIGVAGFCFGNIMMLSFPEYFSIGDSTDNNGLVNFFNFLNLILALPVILYSGSGFFKTAWKGLRHRYLNIDAPIALAILVTFLRSVYEIISGTGAGYMDSMSGIVFFMLLGRYFQDKTYATMAFERDYKSYFPVGATVIDEKGIEKRIAATSLKKDDPMIIRNNEIIPADAILESQQASIDYSFITGESVPVMKYGGDLVYAGGRQIGNAVKFRVIHPTSQSYLTRLWNNDPGTKARINSENTLVEKINRYFTSTVLLISALAGGYWWINDTGKVLDSITAVLIVACPCGLLLTSSFANGNLVRIFGKNRFYLRNASVIEKLNTIDTILFDKTGTITNGSAVTYHGESNQYHTLVAASLAGHSNHPMSRVIAGMYGNNRLLQVKSFEEFPGKGLSGVIEGKAVKLGSGLFVAGDKQRSETSSRVYFSMDGDLIGYFKFGNLYRPGISAMVTRLKKVFDLQILSGDNDAERPNLAQVFGESNLNFSMDPASKMNYVKEMRRSGKHVMMVGDGLNDAGALMHSDVGVAVSDDTNNFSPACDAILDGSAFDKLPAFMTLAQAGRNIIIVTFVFSLLYNIAGVIFAVRGELEPVVAAILMPLSSVSIVLMATLSTNLAAWKLKLL